jgi:hypothetical protein
MCLTLSNSFKHIKTEAIPTDVHDGTSTTPSGSPRKATVHLPGTAQPPGKGPRRSRRVSHHFLYSCFHSSLLTAQTPSEIEMASKTLPCVSCDAKFARKHDLDSEYLLFGNIPMSAMFQDINEFILWKRRTNVLAVIAVIDVLMLVRDIGMLNLLVVLVIILRMIITLLSESILS